MLRCLGPCLSCAVLGMHVASILGNALATLDQQVLEWIELQRDMQHEGCAE